MNINVRRDRLTHAGKQLPRKARVAIIDKRRLVFKHTRVIERYARKTNTAANKAGGARIVAEVEQAVDHAAERSQVTTGIPQRQTSATLTREPEGGLHLIQPGALVGDFTLKPERTKVIAGKQAAVITIAIIKAHRLRFRVTEIEPHILDNHRTKIGANITGAIARECRCGAPIGWPRAVAPP
jgi:hypothetical protein